MGVNKPMGTKTARVPFRSPWAGRRDSKSASIPPSFRGEMLYTEMVYINAVPVKTRDDTKSASIPPSFRGEMLYTEMVYYGVNAGSAV
jgi:hypothetical protein